MSHRKAKAAEVRTGDTIATPQSRTRTLTIDYPTWEHFTSPEGWTGDVIRFTGTDNFGRQVEKGWGQRPDSTVHIVNPETITGEPFGAVQ